jgi:hypothetical protein
MLRSVQEIFAVLLNRAGELCLSFEYQRLAEVDVRCRGVGQKRLPKFRECFGVRLLDDLLFTLD